ncbi:MAG: DUF397 domain-containing protein [Acidimicrobiales bacterium]
MLKLNGPMIRTSRCNWDPPECVEIALRYRDRPWPLQAWFGERMVVEVTDSKHPDQPPHRMSVGAWDRFLRNIHARRPDRDGMFRVGLLRFTAGEWAAFVDGVDAGEFYREFATP